MNLYILWTQSGIKLATYAADSGRAIAKAAKAGYRVGSWAVGQIIETSYAKWII